MFSVRQPFPLLIAAKRRLNDPDFETLLRAIVVISFRYNIIGNFQTSEQERTYHAVAERITTEGCATLQQVFDGLRTVYIPDDTFRAAFADKSIGATQPRNRSIARYILCEFERQKSGADLDFQSDTLSLEHICPTNPNGGWQAFTDADVEELSSRIGNMTLLQSSQNKKLGNAEYADKRPVYADSIYHLTRELAEQNADWKPDRIGARQKALANLATVSGMWRN
ncbi:hypothetical protein CCP2SC5_1750001 [Azospirillaceae bacterium]